MVAQKMEKAAETKAVAEEIKTAENPKPKPRWLLYLAAIGPGIGIGIATYGLCTAAARQPEMKGTLMGYFFIGAAMSEALALLGLVLFFIG